MYEFHGNTARYFELTRKVTEEYIYPYLQTHQAIKPNMRVLEIGCGEAGVLKYFASQGHQVFGIELEQARIEQAMQFLAPEIENAQAKFLNKDIYDVNVQEDIGHTFDLIILKDVIEHIPNQEKFIPELKRYLAPGGFVFMAFPPWQMPFGGHQQVLHYKWASRIPYAHLLPRKLYSTYLRAMGCNPRSIEIMQEIKDTGMSIERFDRIHKLNNYTIVNRRLYLFNPIYKYKFGISPRRQIWPITAIPFLRNFVTMGAYYLLKKD